MRDVEVAQFLNVTKDRWHYLKRVLLSPQIVSDRRLKVELRESTIAEVTDRSLLLEQVGLSLA